MNSGNSSKAYSRFFLFYCILSLLVFLNLIFGPLVRATNSGLACPDWPLCHGKFIPHYTFQIAMEVGHRYYSGVIGILFLFGFVWSIRNPILRKEFLVFTTLSMLFLASQVILGALTVTKLLDPTTVNLHFLNATLLLQILVWICYKSKKLSQTTFANITTKASSQSKASTENPSQFKLTVSFRGISYFFLFTLLLTAYQLFMGGRVSSNYAGLACPDFPTCNGEWFPKLFGTIRYQMEHRYVGYAVAVLIFLSTFFSKRFTVSKTSQRFWKLASLAILWQIFLGACNVWFHIPKWITVVHSASGVLVLSLVFLSLLSSFENSERA